LARAKGDRMNNPFMEVRQQLKLRPVDIATALDVSFMTVRQAEDGRIRNPRKYAKALENAGIIESAEHLLEKHRIWLSQIKGEVIEDLKARA